MANCAIVGINWGDEGKGRMVDLLTEDYDVVVRFQGRLTLPVVSTKKMAAGIADERKRIEDIDKAHD